MLSDKTRRDLEEYKILEVLGEGSFAQVYKAQRKISNDLVAIKHIHISDFDANLHQYMQKEIEIMKKINNKYLVKFLKDQQVGEDLYIIMELCDIDLQQLHTILLRHNQFLHQEPILLKILKQLAKAIEYLHQSKIMHRDIKLENILIVFQNRSDLQKLQTEQLGQSEIENIIRNCRFKLSDFGLSKKLEFSNQLQSTYAGSELTMAPEIKNDDQYGLKSDIYSLGCVVYFFLVGFYPFNPLQLGISKENVLDFENKNISKEMKNLITQMLKYDPNERIDIKQIIEFMKKNFFGNNIKQTFDISAKQQDSEDSIKPHETVSEEKTNQQISDERKKINQSSSQEIAQDQSINTNYDYQNQPTNNSYDSQSRKIHETVSEEKTNEQVSDELKKINQSESQEIVQVQTIDTKKDYQYQPANNIQNKSNYKEDILKEISKIDPNLIKIIFKLTEGLNALYLGSQSTKIKRIIEILGILNYILFNYPLMKENQQQYQQLQQSIENYNAKHKNDIKRKKLNSSIQNFKIDFQRLLSELYYLLPLEKQNQTQQLYILILYLFQAFDTKNSFFDQNFLELLHNKNQNSISQEIQRKKNNLQI